MKRVMNLYDALVACAGDPQNPELKNWAKRVRQVNLDIPTGWMYIGDFVKKGTSEVEIEASLYIVHSTSGTEENPVPFYRVVIMEDDGELHRTDICTDGLTAGWALRIRDDIVDLLISFEIQGLMERSQYNNLIPVETIDLLEKEALQALDSGDDLPVYPEILLTLIHHYRERMDL